MKPSTIETTGTVVLVFSLIVAVLLAYNGFIATAPSSDPTRASYPRTDWGLVVTALGVALSGAFGWALLGGLASAVENLNVIARSHARS